MRRMKDILQKNDHQEKISRRERKGKKGAKRSLAPLREIKKDKHMKKNMLEKTRLTLVILAIALSMSAVKAQEVLPAAGGHANGTGGNLSYTIGQLNYLYHTSEGGAVAEGIQMAYEITVVTSVEDAPEIELNVSAYPNPTTDYLTLEIGELNISDVSFYLFDMQGKVIHSEKITGNITRIYMRELLPAIYFVRIVHSNREVKIFKVIKN